MLTSQFKRLATTALGQTVRCLRTTGIVHGGGAGPHNALLTHVEGTLPFIFLTLHSAGKYYLGRPHFSRDFRVCGWCTLFTVFELTVPLARAQLYIPRCFL